MTSLNCHSETPDLWVRDLKACVTRSSDGAIDITYILAGDLDSLLIQEPVWRQREDPLWEHTCFEAFIQERNKAEYFEFNFTPSRQWAAYAFSRYREPEARRWKFDPAIQVKIEKDRLILEATIPTEALQLQQKNSPLILGLSAVIEDKTGGISYWALRHPAKSPDFHNAEGFVLAV